jgi:hypothetical protein
MKTDNPLDSATQRRGVRERCARFEQLDIIPKDDSDQFIREWDDEHNVSEFFVSASITDRSRSDN